MKSDRRHELRHNDLAEWILKGYEQVVPYKNAIFGASLLLVVLFIGLALWHNHNVSEAEEAWNKLGVPVFQPVFADDRTIGLMDQAAKTYQGEPAAQWAEVFAADSALLSGTNRILTSKNDGIKSLNDAQKRYGVALETLTIPGAREQAMFGKARAMESLIQNANDLKAAREAYEELKNTFPKGMFTAIAEQRIERLQKKDALTFYEALAQYTPKPKMESPRSKLDSLTPLPENPTDEPLPAPSLTPTEPLKPQTTKPGTSKPEDLKPEIRKPGTPQPETPKPEVAKPEAPKPEAPKPATSKTESAKPEPPKKDK